MAYLHMKGITKQFPGGVIANADVDLQVNAGEIHALVGENGAGKTTLMNILYGVEQPDAGEIWLDGQHVTIPNPQTAIGLRIGMVHQHFQLVPSLTVAENIALGYEPTRGLFVDEQATNRRVSELSETFGLKVDPGATVANLSVGQQQRVEILKLLYRDARLLILDEPSAVLTPQEVNDLFSVLRRLATEGHTIIFITHKLYEITDVCQRATVLRRGKVVGCVDIEATSADELARLMVGRSIEVVQRPSRSEGGDVKLSVRNLEVEDDRRLPSVKGMSFEVRAGEILGIAGVEGNGQRELIEALVGIRPVTAGSISLDGHPIEKASTRRRRSLGLALIPEDRKREGLSGDIAIWENVIADTYYTPPASRFGMMDIAAIRRQARAMIGRFDIRAGSETAQVRTLSGGNAQKVVIARELAHAPVALVAAQPTRGLDIGATHFVHEQLLAMRAAGVAVLLISADLDELLFLSDRIGVLYNGRLIKTLAADEATREQLGLYMAGKKTGQAMES